MQVLKTQKKSMSLKLKNQENNSLSLALNQDKILKGLNTEQADAVKSLNGPLIIVAGAGSGKTKVITHRIANLLDNGIAPWNILALTFTNKAAKELKHRIATLVGENLSDKIWAGTFHSVFARILRYEAKEIGYDSNFTIYDADDQLAAIRSVMNMEGVSQQHYPPQQIRSFISNAKNQMIDAKEYNAKAINSLDKQVGFVYKHYESYLRQNNAMDFDDLLLNMIYLLGKSQDVLNKYQNKFKYILVDEYQDTNKAQYIVINLLSKAHQNICVVGDDAQSIYKWRGADIRNILDFQKQYPYAKIVRLEQNYRSTKTILEAADSLIKYNKNQIPKTLWTQNKQGDLIEVISCEDEKDEASKIVNNILKSIGKYRDIRDFAILYRTNAQSLFLENALRFAKLPYVIIGGISFYKRKEVKDALAYIKILVNHYDAESLLRIVNEPPRGLGNTSLQHIKEYSKNNNITLYEAFNQADMNSHLQGRAVTAAKKFINLIDKYKTDLENDNIKQTVMNYLDDTGLAEMYKEIGTEEANDRWNNIQQVISDITTFIKENPESTLGDYLQQISLLSDYDEKDTSGNHVTLMTLHSAKGLEYPTVFIAGMEQGLFPLIRGGESDKDDLEEERRLLYVGITRAEEQLYLSYAQRRTKFGETQFAMPSSFLREIDLNTLNWPSLKRMTEKKEQSERQLGITTLNKIANKGINEYSQVNDDYSYSQVPTQAKAPAPKQESYKVGDIVNHSMFGRGMVTGMKGDGDMKQAIVRFDKFGKKNLMLKFAKLEKIK